MIAIKSKDSNKKYFINDNGQDNSHLHIIFYKTLSYIKNGILPVYVFDGKPPDIKSKVLNERRNNREKAKEKLKDINITDDERIKFEKRTITISNRQIKECFYLLKIMGIPYIKAPEEADSQCAAMAMFGSVDAVASEDMDLLAFGTPILLRNLSTKKQVTEINLLEAIKELDLDDNNIDGFSKFIDLCILLQCDYCPVIKGVGPVNALQLIKKFGNLKEIVNYINNNNISKFKIPNDFLLKADKAKKYFLEATILNPDNIDVKWNKPDEELILNLLCHENNFNYKNISNSVDKLLNLYDVRILKNNNNTRGRFKRIKRDFKYYNSKLIMQN